MWTEVRCIVGLTLVALTTYTVGEDGQPGCSCVCKPVLKTESIIHPANSTSQWLLDAALSQISKHETILQKQQKEINKLKDSLKKQGKSIEKLEEEKKNLHKQNKKLNKKVKGEFSTEHCDNHEKKATTKQNKYTKEAQKLPQDCADLQISGMNLKYKPGRKVIQRIYPFNNTTGFKVLCDFDTDKGGWTIIQRRIEGTESFSRKWETYKVGFGKLLNDFWLGNDKISTLTNNRMYELRVEMGDFKGKKAYADYSSFHVDDEKNNYKLTIGQYKGKAGNSLKYHNNKYFSTYDHDNDLSKSGNCADENKGGWWYGRCYDANLNGKYDNKHKRDGVVWYHWKNNHTPLKWTEMKIRPIGIRSQLNK